MLAANETVAEFMSTQPCLYRVHETPDPLKLERLTKSLEAVGVPVPRDFNAGNPASLKRVLEATEGKPTQALVHMMVLRSLKQAVYSSENRGHYGLASRCYTHFTSPIRRYPDLIVHRLIKEKLHGLATPARLAAWKARLPDMTLHTSRRERTAVEAEREYLDVQRVRFMEKHVGETFSGVISSVTNFGMFVQLKDYFVEGLVHITNLQDDYYFFDEARMTLRGKRSGRRFEMGQPVEVLLAAANTVKRQLDFELVSSGGRKVGSDKQPRSHRPPQRRAGSASRAGAQQRRRSQPSGSAGSSRQGPTSGHPTHAAPQGRPRRFRRRRR
jgi:ribonuclease R